MACDSGLLFLAQNSGGLRRWRPTGGKDPIVRERERERELSECRGERTEHDAYRARAPSFAVSRSPIN